MKNLTRQITDHSHQLKYYAFNLTRNDEDANDLMQETMFKALKNRDRYVHNKNLRSWLFTIMKNTFINQYRRNKYKQKMMSDAADLKGAVLSGIEDEINIDMYVVRSDIREALNKLNAKYSVPFMLFYKGYKYTEISKRLDLPLGTVKSRIYFARKMLMSDLKGLY
ncbi:MAG: RNA polymerase sigma factor [Bacteroidota bacterium]